MTSSFSDTTGGIVFVLSGFLSALLIGFCAKRWAYRGSFRRQEVYKNVVAVAAVASIVFLLFGWWLDIDDSTIIWGVFAAVAAWTAICTSRHKRADRELYAPYAGANPWSNPRPARAVDKRATLLNCPKCASGDIALVLWKASPSVDERQLIAVGQAITYEDLGLDFHHQQPPQMFCKTCHIGWWFPPVPETRR